MMNGFRDCGESKKALVKKGFAMSRPPVGYVSLGKPTRQWVKDPDPAVQQTITEVFTLYERLRSLRRVAAHLRDAGILLPANRRTGGGVVWRPALARSVARIVTNPHYAGYYCWGKKHASLLFGRVERGPARGRAKARTVPREQWHLVDNHHEAYIEPDRFWRMRANRWSVSRHPAYTADSRRTPTRSRGMAIDASPDRSLRQ